MSAVIGNSLLATFVQVTVYSEKWKPMTFPAHPGDRVNKIKEHVRSKTRVPVQDQVLQLGSKTLKPQWGGRQFCGPGCGAGALGYGRGYKQG